MTAKRKTGGGPGTNQYGIRGTSSARPDRSTVDRFASAAAPTVEVALRDSPAEGSYAERWMPTVHEEYNRWMTCRGRDPEAELVTARLHGWTPGMWMAASLSDRHIQPANHPSDPYPLSDQIVASGPPAAWHAAFMSGNSTLMEQLVGSNWKPDEIADALVDHDDRLVRIDAACCADARVALAMADDADPEVRAALTYRNAGVPAVADRLARDPDRAVRLALVEASRTSREILRTLASDPDPDIAGLAAAELAQRR